MRRPPAARALGSCLALTLLSAREMRRLAAIGRIGGQPRGAFRLLCAADLRPWPPGQEAARRASASRRAGPP
jgi:hypothetical protein